MKERPILFSAPMVRAILAGTKTQTRRVVKPVGKDDAFTLVDYGDGWWPYRSDDGESSIRADGNETPISCPYGRVGDRLWVREAWRTLDSHDHIPPREMNAAYRVWFEADRPHQPGFGKLRPSMFMPRWPSRITLEIVGVRVERLQDISVRDCIGEGIPRGGPENPDGIEKRDYRSLWEFINGPGSWDANPWVWVVEFKAAAGREA